MKKLYLKTRSHSLDAPDGPLAEHLGTFEGLLSDQRYGPNSTRRHLRIVADFSVWLKRRNMSVDEVTHESAQRYLHCREQCRCRRNGTQYALRRFVQLLQENGVIAS